MWLFVLCYVLLESAFWYTQPVAAAMVGNENGRIYDCDDRYSFRSFAGQSLVTATDLNNRVICLSTFQSEQPDTTMFPADMKGATFVACNLDNVVILDGNTIVSGSTRRWQRQNDGENWLVDGSNQPIEPLNKEEFEGLGLSTDPTMIPSLPLLDDQAQPTTITQLRQTEIRNEVNDAVEAARADALMTVTTAVSTVQNTASGGKLLDGGVRGVVP